MKDRESYLKERLHFWQVFLRLQQWDLQVRLHEFTRTDYPQSGDIQVDTENLRATVLVTARETGRDSAVILHELLHLALWRYDHFAENFVPESEKDTYFDLLEKAIGDLTGVIHEADAVVTKTS